MSTSLRRRKRGAARRPPNKTSRSGLLRSQRRGGGDGDLGARIPQEVAARADAGAFTRGQVRAGVAAAGALGRRGHVERWKVLADHVQAVLGRNVEAEGVALEAGPA